MRRVGLPVVSPMPPSPILAVTWYGPRVVPGARAMGRPSIAWRLGRQTREFPTGDSRCFTFALGCSTVQLACGKVD